jgi:hypothetical protein
MKSGVFFSKMYREVGNSLAARTGALSIESPTPRVIKGYSPGLKGLTPGLRRPKEINMKQRKVMIIRGRIKNLLDEPE